MTKKELEEVFDLSKGIRTRSGLWVDLFNLDIDQVNIHDIAWALSMNCRFNGHIQTFYSVAQHSCWVADHCNSKFEGLMHDISEAYLTDIPSPYKQHMPEYKVIESRVMSQFSERFGFQYPFPEDVKKADVDALAYEWEHFMLSDGNSKLALPQQQAYEKFLKYFYQFNKRK